jgi:isopentenyl phosphate kinase
MRPLVFVKWGGSIITDKSAVKKPRIDVIRRLGEELRTALPEYNILLGHGSGSFGHWAAKSAESLKDKNPKQYAAYVHSVAAELNHIVVSELVNLGIPAFHVPPSAIIFSKDDYPTRLCTGALREMLRNGYLPVTYGDAVPDGVRGGTIFSTERVFYTLNPILKPKRIVLISDVNGVYTADPHDDPNAKIIPEITPKNFEEIRDALGGSKTVDVTGGMLAKVETMLATVRTSPWLESVVITSAEPGSMLRAIRGEHVGTIIRSD